MVVEEDGDQGSGDSIKPLDGRLTLVSLPFPLSCWCRRCCEIHLWDISKVYGNDNLERSPPHLYLYLVLYSNKMVETKIVALPVLRTREP